MGLRCGGRRGAGVIDVGVIDVMGGGCGQAGVWFGPTGVVGGGRVSPFVQGGWVCPGREGVCLARLGPSHVNIHGSAPPGSPEGGRREDTCMGLYTRRDRTRTVRTV